MLLSINMKCLLQFSNYCAGMFIFLLNYFSAKFRMSMEGFPPVTHLPSAFLGITQVFHGHTERPTDLRVIMCSLYALGPRNTGHAVA
jgi:hypothetical protein